MRDQTETVGEESSDRSDFASQSSKDLRLKLVKLKRQINRLKAQRDDIKAVLVGRKAAKTTSETGLTAVEGLRDDAAERAARRS